MSPPTPLTHHCIDVEPAVPPAPRPARLVRRSVARAPSARHPAAVGDGWLSSDPGQVGLDRHPRDERPLRNYGGVAAFGGQLEPGVFRRSALVRR
jgi:hypothetical protein